jgi:cytidylate kinase
MAIITISRGTLSGAKAVAEQAAAWLGYPCVSREVIVDAARECGIEEGKLVGLMEESPPYWKEAPGKRVAYLNAIVSALLERAEGGNLVYHGHLAHLLLHGIGHVLRVRIVANLEFRIRSLMEQEGMDREEAKAAIDKLDKHRARWAHFLYGVEWQDPSLFDVVFNLERMSVAGTVAAIVRLAESDDFKATRASLKAHADLRLGSQVWTALIRDERTKGSALRVSANDGQVMVVGSAASSRALEAIPEVAKSVSGVEEVHSEAGMGSDWFW